MLVWKDQEVRGVPRCQAKPTRDREVRAVENQSSAQFTMSWYPYMRLYHWKKSFFLLPLHLSFIFKSLVILFYLSHQSVDLFLAVVQSFYLLAVTWFVEDYLETVLDEWVLADEGLAVVGPDFRGREKRIYAEFEDVFDHCGNDPLKMRAAKLETRVCIDLDQPRLEILINHEVQTQQLKVILPSAAV